MTSRAEHCITGEGVSTLAGLPAVHEVLEHPGLAAQRATLDHALLVADRPHLERWAAQRASVDVVPGESQIDSGSAPRATLPTRLLDLRALLDPEALIAALAASKPDRA